MRSAASDFVDISSFPWFSPQELTAKAISEGLSPGWVFLPVSLRLSPLSPKDRSLIMGRPQISPKIHKISEVYAFLWKVYFFTLSQIPKVA